MLLRFRVANVRSLRDEQELSLVVPDSEVSSASHELKLGDDRPINVFTLIGIFGANASGKSNVLAALVEMRAAVLNSYARWASYDGIPRNFFTLDAKQKSEPSFYEVDLTIDGVRWTYGFELGTTRVETEWLHSYPRGHRQVWLDRDASRSVAFEWPGTRVKDRSQLVRRTRPNALLLSTAGTDNHPQLSPIFHWFRRNLWLISPENERTQREQLTTRELSGDRATRINELLAVADLGITGAEVVQQEKGEKAVRRMHRSPSGDVSLIGITNRLALGHGSHSSVRCCWHWTKGQSYSSTKSMRVSTRVSQPRSSVYFAILKLMRKGLSSCSRPTIRPC